MVCQPLSTGLCQSPVTKQTRRDRIWHAPFRPKDLCLAQPLVRACGRAASTEGLLLDGPSVYYE